MRGSIATVQGQIVGKKAIPNNVFTANRKEENTEAAVVKQPGYRLPRDCPAQENSWGACSLYWSILIDPQDTC